MFESRLQLKPPLLGLALTLASLAVYEPALHSFVAASQFDALILPFTASALGALLVVGAVQVLGRPASFPRFALDGMATIGSGGFAVLSLVPFGVGVQIVVGVVAGIAAAFVLLAWGRRYRGLAIQEALLHIALSCVFSALLMNLVGNLPLPLAVVFFAVFSLVGADMSQGGFRKLGEGPTSSPEMSGGSAKTVGALLLGLAEPLTGIFLFSLMFSTMGDHHEYLYYLSFLLGTFLSGLSVIPLLLLSRKRPLMDLMYQVIMPLLGLVLIVAALVVPPDTQGLVARNGFMLFYAFAAMLCLASLVGYATAGEYAEHRIMGSAVAAYGLGGVLGTATVAIFGRSELMTSIFLALTSAYIIALAMRPSILAWVRGGSASAGEPGVEAAKCQEGEIVRDLAERFGLTEREREILALVAEGEQIAPIARVLFISESTVRGHLHHIYQKLGVPSREGLALLLTEERASVSAARGEGPRADAQGPQGEGMVR